MIRLDGAVDFAQSLSINDTLTYLDLSFNSLGTDGGVMLGVSILTNKRYRKKLSCVLFYWETSIDVNCPAHYL